MAVTVVTKGGGKTKHRAPSLTAKTYCGIAANRTMKAAGPALKRAMCPTCAKGPKGMGGR